METFFRCLSVFGDSHGLKMVLLFPIFVRLILKKRFLSVTIFHRFDRASLPFTERLVFFLLWLTRKTPWERVAHRRSIDSERSVIETIDLITRHQAIFKENISKLQWPSPSRQWAQPRRSSPGLATQVSKRLRRRFLLWGRCVTKMFAFKNNDRNKWFRFFMCSYSYWTSIVFAPCGIYVQDS